MMTQHFVSFSTQGKRRLLRLADVQEIIPMVALEAVEGGDVRCRGVINLRGEVIAVFDAGAGRAFAADQFIIILRRRDARVGLIVDEVHDVIAVASGQVSAPAVGPDAQASVVRIDQELIPVWRTDDQHPVA